MTAKRSEKKYEFRANEPMSVERRWNVPPENSVHVCLSKESNGMFYTSVEDYLDGGVWKHREGSSWGHSKESEAVARAEELWLKEQAGSGGQSRFKGTPEYGAHDAASQEGGPRPEDRGWSVVSRSHR